MSEVKLLDLPLRSQLVLDCLFVADLKSVAGVIPNNPQTSLNVPKIRSSLPMSSSFEVEAG